ncbi:hypothetical protein Tco_0531313 [Tanacetum coccineum]
MVKTGLVEAIDSLAPLDKHLATFRDDLNRRKRIFMKGQKIKLKTVKTESWEWKAVLRVNSPCFLVKSWLVQDQTVLGKDYSNLLIADSLLKTIWFINAPCYDNEALASPNTNDEELSIPEQTATGKGTSNPLMAGSLPKTTKPTYVIFMLDDVEISTSKDYTAVGKMIDHKCKCISTTAKGFHCLKDFSMLMKDKITQKS